MSEKRRDNRKRILRNGESQRPDGRYVYKYYDILKKPHFLYSWKLEPTDKLPMESGRACPCESRFVSFRRIWWMALMYRAAR